MEIKQIQFELFKEYRKNGYLDSWTAPVVPSQTEALQKKLDIAELGLVVTEISEAMEEIRSPEGTTLHMSIECADAIIRLLNFMSRKGVDAGSIILQKHAVNMHREPLHGKDV